MAAAISRRLRSTIPLLQGMTSTAASSSRSFGCTVAISNCTIWYMYHMVQLEENGVMGELHVEAEGTTVAGVDTVWAAMADANTTRTGVPGTTAVMTLRPRVPPTRDQSNGSASDDAPPLSRGFSRSMHLRGSSTRSERGIPVKNYRAEVTLTPNDPRGTSIRWTATWERTLMGRLVYRKLQIVYRQVMDALVAATDSHHAVGGSGEHSVEAPHDSS